MRQGARRTRAPCLFRPPSSARSGTRPVHGRRLHHSGRQNGSIHDAVQPNGELDEAFVEHVRDQHYRMPTITLARFAPHYDETMPLVGWSSAAPWRSTATTLVPEPQAVTSKAQIDAAMTARDRNRPHGSRGRSRKPRKA
ncbi:hypothetical protein [Streptomyces sp. SID13726]|uniref:hypothetical protein n=1 Tax=Streptomyces sp. SID13726 TaxID=2706058 RepID=UPI0013BCE990|nr:hypothetical protein [Streptomyces sp. SID13726]NEB00844.1 hypothetical protein [Streptomyces sp. SID13726]